MAEVIIGPGCPAEATRGRPSSLASSLRVRGSGEVSANGSRVLLGHAGEAFAGLLDGASRGLGDGPAVLNDVLQALANQFALDRDELLDRPGTCQLVEAVEVAPPLLLAQLEPVARGVLEGLGQHRAAARDGFEVLLGLAGEALAVLSGEAEGAGEPIGGFAGLLRGRLDAS